MFKNNKVNYPNCRSGGNQYSLKGYNFNKVQNSSSLTTNEFQPEEADLEDHESDLIGNN